MPPVEFEPTISAGRRPKTYTLDCRPLEPTRCNDRPRKILETTFMNSFSVMSTSYYLSPSSFSSSPALHPVMELGFQYYLSCSIPDGLWPLPTCFFFIPIIFKSSSVSSLHLLRGLPHFFVSSTVTVLDMSPTVKIKCRSESIILTLRPH